MTGRRRRPGGPWGRTSRRLLDLVVRPLLALLVVLVKLLPRGVLLAAIPVAGRALARLLPLRVFRRNLRAVRRGRRDEAELEAESARGLSFVLRTVADVVKVLDQRAQPVAGLCRLEGREVLDAALARGRGVILASLHTGNWELAAARIAGLGTPFGILYFEQIAPVLDRYLNRVRERSGVTLHHQRRGLRAALRHLSAGGILGIMSDQDGTANGLFTRFFEVPVSVPRGVPYFARATGAPVVLTWNEALVDGTYVQRFEPFETPPDMDGPGWELAVVDRLMARFEAIVRADPAQWLLAYDRFKLRHQHRLEELGLGAISRQCQACLDGGPARMPSSGRTGPDPEAEPRGRTEPAYR